MCWDLPSSYKGIISRCVRNTVVSLFFRSLVEQNIVAMCYYACAYYFKDVFLKSFSQKMRKDFFYIHIVGFP